LSSQAKTNRPKIWSSDKAIIGVASTHLDHWADELDHIENNEIQEIVNQIRALSGQLNSFYARSISRQISPDRIYDEKWMQD
jgi:hypothetical protein